MCFGVWLANGFWKSKTKHVGQLLLMCKMFIFSSSIYCCRKPLKRRSLEKKRYKTYHYQKCALGQFKYTGGWWCSVQQEHGVSQNTLQGWDHVCFYSACRVLQSTLCVIVLHVGTFYPPEIHLLVDVRLIQRYKLKFKKVGVLPICWTRSLTFRAKAFRQRETKNELKTIYQFQWRRAFALRSRRASLKTLEWPRIPQYRHEVHQPFHIITSLDLLLETISALFA